MLREIRDRWQPSSLVAVDVLPWLARDLTPDVEFHIGDALTILPTLAPAGRVLSVETLEHLEAPWLVLRLLTRLVMPGGRLVITTPNITNVRHRLELLVRGQLTSFRPYELQHVTPIIPHIVEATLREEGMVDVRRRYATRDIVPLTGGRRWPRVLAKQAPSLLCTSLIVHARRPTCA